MLEEFPKLAKLFFFFVVLCLGPLTPHVTKENKKRKVANVKYETI